MSFDSGKLFASSKYRKQVQARTIGKLNRIPHVFLHGVEHKSCSRCGSLKPLTEFQRKADKVDGLSTACSSCLRK